MTTPETPGPAGAVTPVCPRHPSRESWVRCQRCHQPVCPECQRPAAVGVQCLDCVSAAARTTRAPRTVLGGRLPGAGVGRPIVTVATIGVCVVTYVLQLARPATTGDFGFAPFLAWSEPWRAITAAFLHSPDQPMHIVLNLFVLWQLGPYLEHLLGHARFAALYAVSALGGSTAVVLLAAAPHGLLRTTQDWQPYESWLTGVVGASGAVFGLFGAIFVVNRHLGRSTGPMLATIVVNAALGFLYPNISWQAHLGGLLTGAMLAGALVALRKPARRRWQWPVVAAVALLVVAAAMAKLLTVPALYR